MDQSEARTVIGNTFIVLSRVVMFIGAGVQALGILWLIGCAFYVSCKYNDQAGPLVAILFYFIGRWHQRRITKRGLKSNITQSGSA